MFILAASGWGEGFAGLFNFANVSNHLILIGIYCILALSLNLINGSLGAFSLGHHGFWGMGAYAAGIVVWTLGSPHGSLVVFAASIVAAIIASALFGLLVGAPCLRLKGDYLAIATLGFAEIFIICARNSESWTRFGDRGLGGAAGFSLGDTYHGIKYVLPNDPLSGNDAIVNLMGSNTGRQWFYLLFVWFFVAVTFVLIRNLIRSGHGRAIQAIRDDETAAELMGVRLIRYKVMVFVVGAALAGLAGALSANYRSSVSPDRFVMMEGIKILLMVVLGGLGSMSGSLIAVAALYISEQALTTVDMRVPFLSFHSGDFQLHYTPLKDLWQVLFALVLIVMMLSWPSGITGGREFSVRLIRARLNQWLENPHGRGRRVLAILLRMVAWGQFFFALPLSESVSQRTELRLLFVGGALVVCLALRAAAHRVERAGTAQLLPGEATG
jgi:branched-chain amino acid transport system permease protein